MWVPFLAESPLGPKHERPTIPAFEIIFRLLLSLTTWVSHNATFARAVCCVCLEPGISRVHYFDLLTWKYLQVFKAFQKRKRTSSLDKVTSWWKTNAATVGVCSVHWIQKHNTWQRFSKRISFLHDPFVSKRELFSGFKIFSFEKDQLREMYQFLR